MTKLEQKLSDTVVRLNDQIHDLKNQVKLLEMKLEDTRELCAARGRLLDAPTQVSGYELKCSAWPEGIVPKSVDYQYSIGSANFDKPEGVT